MLGGIGVLVVVVVALVLGSGFRPTGPVGELGSPRSTATAASAVTTASAAQTSRSTATCAASPGASQTAGSFSIGQPRPGDDTTAVDLVMRYEHALVAGQWQTAWEMLAPEQQALSGPYPTYADDRSAYFKSVAGRYTIKAPTHDLATIRQWVVPDNYPANPIWPAAPDYDRGFVVEIDYPLIAQSNAYDVMLAAPDQCGGWWLWALR